MRARNALTLACLGLALAACSLDYEQARVAESMGGETPETILIGFTHTIVSNGRVWVILEADRAESYAERKEIYLQGVRFREFDSQGELITEARAERAMFDTDSENASVTGSIVIHSTEEEASLEASRLTWTREGRRLEAEPEETVRLEKDDGSFVEGRGFTADFRRKRIEFSSQVRGSYVWEEEEEEEQEP
jgi:LPS export ABC transporter protein LptC